MRKFAINVNGKSYEVEVEEIGTDSVSAPAPSAAPAVKAAPAAKAAPAPKAGSTVVSAPMPGTIVDIKVKAGDAIKANQVLCVLEAMKMENEIMAPQDGTVAAVHVTKGASVNNGDALVSIN